MTHHVFKLLTALSLLLCVAAAGMWARSYFAQDIVEHSTVGHAERTAADGKWRSRQAEDFIKTADHPLGGWGFTWQGLNETMAGHRTYVVGGSSPWWFVVLVCSVPINLRMMGWLYRRRRRRRRQCPSCGYDMTGNMSGVCPECGAGA